MQYQNNEILGHDVGSLVCEWENTIKSSLSVHCHKLEPILIMTFNVVMTQNKNNAQTLTFANGCQRCHDR